MDLRGSLEEYPGFYVCSEWSLIVAFKDKGIDGLYHSQLPKNLMYLLYRFAGFHMSREISLIGPSLCASKNNPIYKGVSLLTPPSPLHPTALCKCYLMARYVVMFLTLSASCLVRTYHNAISPPRSDSCTNHTWIFFLTFCWNVAVISVSSVGVCSFIMNVSWILGCPTDWGCYCCAFSFLCVRGQTAWGNSSISLSITARYILPFILLPFPGIPLLSIPIRLCSMCLDLNLL